MVVLGIWRFVELGCPGDMNRCVETWEPLLVLVFICFCPPCVPMVCSGPVLISSGFWYIFLMLADADLRGGEEYGDALDAARACRGAPVYCRGPMALKAPLQPEPPKAGAEPQAVGSGQEPRGPSAQHS